MNLAGLFAIGVLNTFLCNYQRRGFVPSDVPSAASRRALRATRARSCCGAAVTAGSTVRSWAGRLRGTGSPAGPRAD